MKIMNTRKLSILATCLLAGCASLLLAQSKVTPVHKPKARLKAQSSKLAPDAATAQKDEIKPAAADPSASLPVVGHLETRGKRITIKAGPNGPVYFVKSKDGKVLAKDLTLEQLKAQAPDLHEFIKTS